MKILLFNDNPVVRKLVALSAQKTKDELSVIWSVDEIEESGYDLLIIDDALYSDETFAALKEHATFTTTLLMATRTQAVPTGFDHVINKPFLPTDLVDMFIAINKKVASTPPAPEVPMYAINLEEEELPASLEEDDMFDSFHLDDTDLLAQLGDLDEQLEDDLPELGDFDDDILEPAILDKAEVQEVQGLLDDTEDDLDFEEEITVKGLDDLELPKNLEDDFDFEDELSLDEKSIPSLEDDLMFDDEPSLDETKTPSLEDDLMLDNEFSFEDDSEDDLLSFDEKATESVSDDASKIEEEFGDFELPKELEEDFDFDEEVVPIESVPAEISNDDLMLDDDEMDDLESLISNAVNDLDPEELEYELDDSILEPLQEDIKDEALANDFDGLDEFDALDERELKMAIGEEIEEEEFEPFEDESEPAEIEVAIDEPVAESVPSTQEMEAHSSTHAEGVEALQALLKALSNEDVAKSLKGLNISININFGNDA
jgi:uncharacterized membrane protein